MNRSQPVRLELRPSAAFAVIILVVHGVGALCFLTLSTGWPGFVLAGLTSALGLAAARDRAWLRGPDAPRCIEIHSSGDATCVLRSGQYVTLEPAAASVTRWWVVLRLASARRRNLLVAAGMMAPETFRQLRLWARWRRLPGVVPGQRPA